MEDAKENLGFDNIGEADELADARVTRFPRETPRTSLASQEPKPTPYADLRALAGLIRKTSTPSQRRPSDRPGSAHSAANHPFTTPLPQPWTTPKIRRPLQQIALAGSKPTTPHTIRALQQRRATPGQDRRRSGRAQRETPRDALRNLSKILAVSSQPFRQPSHLATASNSAQRRLPDDEFEDELSPEQPQLSIVVQKEESERDDESSLLDRPRLSMPEEEEEHTVKSVEKARRASLQNEQHSLLLGEHLTGRSVDLGTDVSNNISDVDRQWQGNEDDSNIFLGYPNSGLDLRQSTHEDSKHKGQPDSTSPEQFPQSPVISPFVLDIPNMVPQNVSQQSHTYNGLLSEDIEQFGSPLPFVNISHPQMQNASLHKIAPKTAFKAKVKKRAPRAVRVSRHGISYSSLPVGIVKSISTTFARSTGKTAALLSKDSVNAVLDASDKFFEQLSGDLAAASSHAGRKTIDESDVLAVMRRQRQVWARASAFAVGTKYLPSETLGEMRMPCSWSDRLLKPKIRLQTISEDPDRE